MADDLADFPIVVLENDSPEQVGKVGLFDLRMPVGNTGLVFTAAVPGLLRAWGPVFTDPVQRAANLRAASTLVHMGLVRGESVVFLREALGISQQELADFSGVEAAIVMGWEANSISVPLHCWTALAHRVCQADGRVLPLHQALSPDWRPRVIRVFPNLPARGLPQSNQSAVSWIAEVMSHVPGADCYPPPHC